MLIIPNFVDTDMYRAGSSMVVPDKELFPDTTVLKLMYAGNIGHAQDWEPLIRVAHKLKEAPVAFWIIGEGVLKDQLKKQIEDNGLNNLFLLPYQPRERMPGIVNYADIHFIFMNPQLDGQGLPSKVYSIMACKKPLLITSGLDTPLYNFLKDKDCAFLISEAEIERKCDQIVAVLNSLIENRSVMKDFGEHAFKIIQKKYAKDTVIKQYMQLSKNLLDSRTT
mgnify:CR=1 FL=1